MTVIQIPVTPYVSSLSQQQRKRTYGSHEMVKNQITQISKKTIIMSDDYTLYLTASYVPYTAPAGHLIIITLGALARKAYANTLFVNQLMQSIPTVSLIHLLNLSISKFGTSTQTKKSNVKFNLHIRKTKSVTSNYSSEEARNQPGES